MFPKARVPTVVGRPPQKSSNGEASSSGTLIGSACTGVEHSLAISRPVVNGMIQKWDDMELLWQHTFENKLKIDTRSSRVIITDPPMNPAAARERTMELMFEKFGFEGVCMQSSAVLSLYSQGAALFAATPALQRCATPAASGPSQAAPEQLHTLQAQGCQGSARPVLRSPSWCLFCNTHRVLQLGLHRCGYIAVATLLWLHCYGYVVNRGHHAATVPPCPVTTHTVCALQAWSLASSSIPGQP